jgi:hypothetical protein
MKNTYKIANTTLPVCNGGIGNYTITNTAGYSVSPNVTITNEPASLEVKGKIIHNGRDLEERLKIIEDVLHIPERDVKLEKKYPKLKEMHDEYIRNLKKYRNWETLKGKNND